MYATQFCRLQWVFLTNYNPGCALNKEETHKYNYDEKKICFVVDEFKPTFV